MRFSLFIVCAMIAVGAPIEWPLWKAALWGTCWTAIGVILVRPLIGGYNV